MANTIDLKRFTSFPAAGMVKDVDRVDRLNMKIEMLEDSLRSFKVMGCSGRLLGAIMKEIQRLAKCKDERTQIERVYYYPEANCFPTALNTFHADHYLELAVPVEKILGLIPWDDGDMAAADLQSISCEEFLKSEPRWAHRGCHLVELPRDLVKAAGIGGSQRSTTTVLYMRSRCYQQLRFLSDSVLRRGRIGRIHGHPGTGKSITGLYFAADMAFRRGWNILWVHLKQGRYDCLYMRPDFSCSTRIVMKAEVMERLVSDFHADHQVAASGYMIFVDGQVDGGERIVAVTRGWYHGDRRNRRVILLSSAEGLNEEGFTDQEASDCDQSIFCQWSWKLCEYEKAMSHERFRESVRVNMDAPMKGFTNDIEAKFFYAGGCARYMFQFSTREVETQVSNAIRKQKRSQSGSPGGPFGQIHSLLSFYEGGRYEIVSEYAKSLLIRECGQLELIRLGNHAFIRDNNSMKGNIFELFFKRRAKDLEEIDLLHTDRSGNSTRIVWKIKGVQDIDFRKLDGGITCPLDTLLWPLNSNEPTIDALIVSEHESRQKSVIREVKFLQITVSETHRVDMAVLKRHVKKLKATHASFYFVLPSKPTSRVFDFRVRPIKNAKALASYGWPITTDGIQAHIHVLSLPSWDQ